jgi:hypothetical protein
VLKKPVSVKSTRVDLTITGSESIKLRIPDVDLEIARNMSNLELTVVTLYG